MGGGNNGTRRGQDSRAKGIGSEQQKGASRRQQKEVQEAQVG